MSGQVSLLFIFFMTIDTLPASQPHLLLHLVLDEAGHLPVDPGPAQLPGHLHSSLGNTDDQQGLVLELKIEII